MIELIRSGTGYCVIVNNRVIVHTKDWSYACRIYQSAAENKTIEVDFKPVALKYPDPSP
jgi:hypothetical protein